MMQFGKLSFAAFAASSVGFVCCLSVKEGGSGGAILVSKGMEVPVRPSVGPNDQRKGRRRHQMQIVTTRRTRRQSILTNCHNFDKFDKLSHAFGPGWLSFGESKCAKTVAQEAERNAKSDMDITTMPATSRIASRNSEGDTTPPRVTAADKGPTESVEALRKPNSRRGPIIYRLESDSDSEDDAVVVPKKQRKEGIITRAWKAWKNFCEENKKQEAKLKKDRLGRQRARQQREELRCGDSDWRHSRGDGDRPTRSTGQGPKDYYADRNGIFG